MSKLSWLVAHDFSAGANAALELAASDLDRSGGGELHLLHVYSVPAVPATYEWSGADAIYATSRDLEAALKADTIRHLEGVADRTRTKHMALEVMTHVRSGATAQAIVDTAKELGVERIIVGTHGRTGMSHFLLGSVAERVVRLAEVPVTVAKAAQDEDAGKTSAKENA
jgi:nucleotide-binding universal stress UspA family protein